CPPCRTTVRQRRGPSSSSGSWASSIPNSDCRSRSEKYQGRKSARGVVRPGTTTANDGRVGRLPLLARLAALGQHAGRSAGMRPAGGRALPPTAGVVARFPRGPAFGGFAAHPAFGAGFAGADFHLFGFPDRADGRPALARHAPPLARRQGDLGPFPFAS